MDPHSLTFEVLSHFYQKVMRPDIERVFTTAFEHLGEDQERLARSLRVRFDRLLVQTASFHLDRLELRLRTGQTTHGELMDLVRHIDESLRWLEQHSEESVRPRLLDLQARREQMRSRAEALDRQLERSTRADPRSTDR